MAALWRLLSSGSVIDLHAHMPMQYGAWPKMRPQALVKSNLLSLANYVANYGSKPRTGVPAARAGGLNAVVSVLFDPSAEFDPWAVLGRGPRASYFHSLIDQMDLVELDLATRWSHEAHVVRSFAELEATIEGGRLAVVHAVEGGFHLGADPEEVKRNVAQLAERGVLYITLAHLIYRGVSTNVACLPPLPDSAYHLLFRQPDIGLSELGRAALEQMFEEGVLIDIKHMSRRALDEVLELLADWDPDGETPIAATHMACRLNGSESTIDDEAIAAIAARDGVMGIMASRDFMRVEAEPELGDGIDLFLRHVEHVCDVTGSHRHVAIGTDLDGFIKPIAGLESHANFGALHGALVDRFGDEIAADICQENALRVLKAVWGVKRTR